MALPVTDQLITQMMTENVRTQPTTQMEGNVSRPMIVSDLLSAMRDVNFNQLMEEYGNMAGAPSKKSTPMTQGLMKEQSPQVPPTPLKQEQVQTAKEPQTQEQTPQMEEEIQVPTPMKNAMAMNTLAPTGSIEEPQKNTGLMSDTTQQIA